MTEKEEKMVFFVAVLVIALSGCFLWFEGGPVTHTETATTATVIGVAACLPGATCDNASMHMQVVEIKTADGKKYVGVPPEIAKQMIDGGVRLGEKLAITYRAEINHNRKGKESGVSRRSVIKWSR